MTSYQAVYAFPAGATASDEFALPINAVVKDARCVATPYLRTSPRPSYDLIELEDGTITITTDNWGVQTGKLVYVIVTAPGVPGEKRYLITVYGTTSSS